MSAIDPRLTSIVRAEQNNDYNGICNAVRECAYAGIKLSAIETFLRSQQCRIYLVARPVSSAHLPCKGVDGKAKEFFLFCATDRKEIKNPDLNFLHLNDCGFLESSRV